MPAAVDGTVCGPQVPGTAKPPSGTDISGLNPCPLNACCNIWGQCGTTADFCTDTGTGAPGTAAPGSNGCISNCGTDMVIGDRPEQFHRIAYFEAFNFDRPCLKMDVAQIDTSKYTHVHFAFLDLTPAFEVDIVRYMEQFTRFTKLTGVKRIVSFGGWTMSTSLATYNIFRDAVKPENRQTFVRNLVNFVNEWGLDGVDIDWEYPGAQDLPEIPAGSLDDGKNLAACLVLLRDLLSPDKSLSIATPASYWYLRGFPMAKMAASLDYIVYMTYDLHGQWDYGNEWADPGCPAGNCLRSHVNLTETINALSMITKADVPSNKLAVGIASYGRSFQMTTPNCTRPMCTYTGPDSGAKPGRNARTSHDASSDSDILVYDSVQWVAYMNNTTKAGRVALYQRLNMWGVSDWAVDLQAFVAPPTPTPPGSAAAARP
ncbi:glycoside hydrolase superfamily [Chaetomium fimeti]|uniref:chitinase n=1 Tax=Chaetomium fimeti TaxID=1854472 RepID=A0AAE0H7W1_9PEZI|nr:glycoside hydrolase superfamily [Chaetomium fimeti]